MWASATAIGVTALIAIAYHQRSGGEAPASQPDAGSPPTPDSGADEGCPAGMLLVAGATFSSIGGAPEAVASFCLGRALVTVSDYSRCVAAHACPEPDRGGDCNWGAVGREAHPVNCVDHAEAAAYCGWARARLPTLPEWQWVAQGTSLKTLYPWGNDEPADQLCWSGKIRRHETCVVGAFPAGTSPDGFVDLSGNVRQWTSTLAAHTASPAYELGGGSFDEHIPDYFHWHSSRYFAETTRSGEAGVRCAATPGQAPTKEAVVSASTAPAALPPAEGRAGHHAAGITEGCPDHMVRIEGGSFAPAGTRGTQHVTPFCMDQAEVTVERFARCVEAGKCAEPERGGACNWRAPGREAHPVNCVDQAAMVAYCASSGARLPSDTEWQWAARGAKAGTLYPWGSEEPSEELCWSRPVRRRETCRAGAFPASDSPEGVSDLAGNVLEWTATPAPRGSGTFLVEGGDFQTDAPELVRGGTFSFESGDERRPALGGRCVTSVAR